MPPIDCPFYLARHNIYCIYPIARPTFPWTRVLYTPQYRGREDYALPRHLVIIPPLWRQESGLNGTNWTERSVSGPS